MAEKEIPVIAEELNASRIYLIRGKQVMLSHDLAELYQVEKVQNKVTKHDKQILVILEHLKQMKKLKEQELKHHKRRRIGFK